MPMVRLVAALAQGFLEAAELCKIQARRVESVVQRLLIVLDASGVAVGAVAPLDCFRPAAVPGGTQQLRFEHDLGVIARAVPDALLAAHTVDRDAQFRPAVNLEAALRQHSLHAILHPRGDVAAGCYIRSQGLALVNALSEGLVSAAIGHLNL